ncbi:MAG: hypothetical protein KatS3mg131_2480 [Candidatus Tectimicrobiota bacterium]|nr:MAG: hypothetical protein KatS3mg131_2480 [Candidatus Tectomicrobia bacterium]
MDNQETPSAVPTPEEVRAAYQEAVRTASRCSLLGAIGFGVALLMLPVLLSTGTLSEAVFGTAHPLARFLFLGGCAGGLLFSFQAWRAARLVRACRERLDELS